MGRAFQALFSSPSGFYVRSIFHVDGTCKQFMWQFLCIYASSNDIYAYMPLQIILNNWMQNWNHHKPAEVFFSISVALIFHHFLWWSFTTEPPMISSFLPPHRQYCDYLAYIYQIVSAPSVIWLLVKSCTGTLASAQGPMNRLLLCKCTRSSASNTSPYFIVPRLSRVATFSSKNLNS